MIAFVVSTGQTATLLDLSKIPLNRPVRVTLTDGTFQDGMVSRVTTEFLNLSQKPGLCEDVDVSRVASVSTIKKSGLPQHDKFSPATIVVLVPIALPFFVAFETKHLFEERNHLFQKRDPLYGLWATNRAGDGSLTTLEFSPQNQILWRSMVEKNGTYQVSGAKLYLSYSPGQSGKISQQVIPFQISCNTLTTGLPGQVFALRATAQKRKAVERPIVGEWWKTSNRPNQEMWQFQSDGSFRTTAELPPRIGSYKEVNGVIEIRWRYPEGQIEDLVESRKDSQLFLSNSQVTTTYSRVTNGAYAHMR